MAGNEAIEADALDGFSAEEDGPAQEEAVAAGGAVRGLPSRRARVATILGVVAIVAMVAAAAAGVGFWLRVTPNPLPPSPTGALHLTSSPGGLEALVDGAAAGLTPLTLQVNAGPHTVTLRRGNEERTWETGIKAGADVTHDVDFGPTVLPPVRSAPAAPEPAVPAAGWVSVIAPFDVQVFEGPDLIGTGAVSKIMIPAGTHVLRLSNASLGYDETRKLEVAAAKVATVTIAAPKSTVSANARPWANVFLDGVDVGQTPLASVPVSIGTHEVVFRHPELGEHRETVVISLRGPNRVSADMTKK
jgi:hypothetical protein